MTNLSKSGSFGARTFNKLVQMIWNDPIGTLKVNKKMYDKRWNCVAAKAIFHILKQKNSFDMKLVVDSHLKEGIILLSIFRRSHIIEFVG